MISTRTNLLKKLTCLAALTLASLTVSAQASSPVVSASTSTSQVAFPKAEGMVTPSATRLPVLLESSMPMWTTEKEQSSRELLFPLVNVDALPELKALGAHRCFCRAKFPASKSGTLPQHVDYLKCFDKDGKALGEGHLSAHVDASPSNSRRETLVLEGGVIRWTTF